MAATIDGETTISPPPDNPDFLDGAHAIASRLSDAEVRARLLASTKERARLLAEEAVLFAEAERRNLARSLGHRSMPVLLSAETKESSRTFGRRNARAISLANDFPQVHQALFEGRIGTDHAKLILRTANKPRLRELAIQAQDGFVEWAVFEDWGRFTRFMEAWAEVVDPADPQDLDERRWEQRGFSFTEFDGVVMIQINTTTMAFAQFQAAGQPLVDKMFAEDWADARARCGPNATASDLTRSDSQRWHDAWIQLSRAGHGLEVPGTKLVVNVVQDQETFDTELSDAMEAVETSINGEPAPTRTPITADEALQRATTYRTETLTGLTVSRPLALRAAVMGHLRHWRINTTTHDFEATKTARLFTGIKRIGLIIRDPHCSTPGCQTPAHRCHMDHITPHARGGPTNPRNGQPQCPPCHRHKTMLETLGYI